VKIWKVKFGNWDSYNIEAPNVGCAIQKIMSFRKRNHDTYMNRIQDITEVELIAEA